MESLRKTFFLLLGLALVFWSFSEVLKKPAPAKYQVAPVLPTLVIEGRKLPVEIADTPEKREQGLSGRESLPEGSGMLFIFENPATYGFWMKEMRFPIDIVWLSGEVGSSTDPIKVIDIERNVQPNTFPHIFYPPVPVKYVLETNPGEL